MTSVRLDQDDMSLLERIADEKEMTFSDVWRHALRAYAHELKIERLKH